MGQYKCEVCYYIYDEEKQGLKWDGLHDGWLCPVCQSPISVFTLVKDISVQEEETELKDEESIQS